MAPGNILSEVLERLARKPSEERLITYFSKDSNKGSTILS